MTNLKEVEKALKDFNNNMEDLSKELKRVQSIKCRLKKQKFKSTYEKEMQECLSYEQVLKEARQLLDPKDKPITLYTQEDIDLLDYNDTMKAIRSIQSKKTNSKWLTVVEGESEEYKNACRIEVLLLEHKKNVKPLDETCVSKVELVKIIDTIESSGNLSQEKIVELLKSLV